jgi:AFG3 family protein
VFSCYEKKDNSDQKNVLRPNPTMGWIYVIIILVITMVWYSSSNSVQEITWQKFERDLLTNHVVDKLVVINKERVEVYIVRDSIVEPQHQNVFKKLLYPSPVFNPAYYFNIGSIEVFNDNLAKAQEGFSESEIVPVSYINSSGW